MRACSFRFGVLIWRSRAGEAVIVGGQQVLGERNILPQPLDVYFLYLGGVKVANHVASPRMPHTLGEIFAHAQLLDFKNRNSWAGPGAASVLVDQHVRSGPETRSQQPPLLQTAAEPPILLVDQLAKKTWKLIVEFVTTKRLVSKNGHSLVEPPSRVFYTVSASACLFVGERFFQKVYERPLPSTSPFTLFAR